MQTPRPFPVLLLTAVFIIGLWGLAGVYEVLKLPPQGYHVWAQADRAAAARLYHQDGIDLLHPKTYYLASPSGEAGMEFPIMNAGAALVYDLFGFDEFWYRLLMLVVVFAGLLAFADIALRFLTWWSALLLTCLWSLSPLITFYGPNFLPDAAALGFTLLAWATFVRHRSDPNKSKLIAIFIFLGMACLMKPTACAHVLIMAIIAWRSWSGREWLALGVPLLLCAIWYVWADWLNRTNGTFVFSLQPHPPASIGEAWSSIRGFASLFWSRYHSPFFWSSMAIGIVFMVWRWKRVSLDLRRILGMSLGALAGFLVLFLSTAAIHDYYGLLWLIPFMFLSVATVSSLEPLSKSTAGWVPFILLLLLKPVGEYSEEQLESASLDWNTGTFPTLKDIRDRHPVALKIPEDAKVLTLTDHSLNVSLYYFNRRGWTVWPTRMPPNLDSFIGLGATHIAITDSLLLRDTYLSSYLGPMQDSVAGINFYSIRQR